MSAHFSPAAFKFLRGLARNNDREWFNERKPVYEQELKAPMLDLINQINEAFVDFAPDFIRPAHKSLMRIYRDIRFAKDKRPYKTNVAAWWARQGLEKTSGGGFYFEINATHITIAAGVYMPEREQLLAIRRHLLDHHEELRGLFSAKKTLALLTPFDGLKLTRAPKGFPADHPALDLILQRQWGVSAQLPADLALTPKLTGEIVKRFKAAAPIVDLLNAPLVRRPSKPLF
ncbi:DUF2461 domain-containing protein [Granulicella tundricola]|uniref:TIGR02453 family protein n=1 Tax=Granulicella tundricola (strain ATCC BAA-1859 / DSM 23138 / MP5ACTX9) TaxID=1198114 RepID=E8WWM3_GRATM|nr:DUF2461 domain-containing protein [Granulicella tundricola]ADW70768.1 Conserved hypothetical protein CHP02453 [Granulicella tundricola MP5ACTX9]